MSLVDAFFVFGCAMAAVVVGLVLLSRGVQKQKHVQTATPNGLHYLFYDLDLEHASDGAATLLSDTETETDWHALRAGLISRFPGFPNSDALRDIDELTLKSFKDNDPGILRLSRENEKTRIVIEQDFEAGLGTLHKVKSLEAELEPLRLAARDAPYPIWLTDADGAIVWHNASYSSLFNLALPNKNIRTTPLFDIAPRVQETKHSQRAPITIEGTSTTEWYNVTATRAIGGVVYHAVDINAVILAEIAQRNFVQTLAKTFAQLSIGLAIFDRNRQLALFNPALVDLTSLPPEFLSARPDLLSFFDRLRDNRMMPEPKNYSSWRHEISEVIAAASRCSYQETWTLDTGQTYRVNGRPHPDGAVAFLIEDITAEISLTRNFRAELELGQSLMDTFDDALVAFSSTGVLTFCNAAYRDMWKVDPDNSFADVTILDAIKDWQITSDPNPAWGDMRDFVMKLGDRASWDAEVKHKVHGRLLVQVSPIVSGATVIRFSETAPLRFKAPLITA